MIEPNSAPRSLIWSPLRWLIIGEILVFTLAAQFAFSLQPPADAEGVAGDALWQLFASLGYGGLMAATLHALGMHSLRTRQNAVQHFMKYAAGAGVGMGALWLIVLMSSPETATLSGPLTGVALALAMLLVWRVFVHVLLDSEALRHRVVVLGAGKSAKMFNDALRRRADRRGLSIVGYLPLSGDDDHGLEARHVLYSRTTLQKTCRRMKISEIVVAGDDRRGALPLNELLECRFHGIKVTQAATFVERECGRIPVELVEPSWWLYRKGFAGGGIRDVLKRTFDLSAGILLLVLAAPIMLACAVAIRLEGGKGSTVLFRQTRVGRNGSTFSLIKFRSMREDAESDGVARWAKADDDRVTRVGAFLRKMRLDELPQLFNVLGGEMSLVGPRPERPEFVRELARKIPYYEQRHALRPGITGWAQLSYPYGASTRDALEKLKYDLYYIKNHSLGFDIEILLRTVEVVIFGKGAR